MTHYRLKRPGNNIPPARRKSVSHYLSGKISKCKTLDEVVKVAQAYPDLSFSIVCPCGGEEARIIFDDHSVAWWKLR